MKTQDAWKGLLEDWVEELAAAAQTSDPSGSGDAWVMRSRVALHSQRAVLAPLHRSFMVVRELTDEEDETVVYQRAGWQQFTITPTYGAGQFSGMAEFTVPMTPGKASRLKLTPGYFEAYQAGYGFDDTVWPPVQSVPVRDVTQNYLRRVSLRVAPGLEEQFGIEVSNTTVATIVVERTAELITVVITGENPGTAYLTARWLPDNEIVTVMEINVLAKTTRDVGLYCVPSTPGGVVSTVPIEEFQQRLNQTWGVQANAWVTITEHHYYSPFDLDPDGAGPMTTDGMLDIERLAGEIKTPEEDKLEDSVRNWNLNQGKDWGLALVQTFFGETSDRLLGYAYARDMAFMQADGDGDIAQTAAHEIGHLLLNRTSADHNSSSSRNLMHPLDSLEPDLQREIRRKEWRRVYRY